MHKYMHNHRFIFAKLYAKIAFFKHGLNMTQYDNDNVFAKILRGELPCDKIYEDDHTLAFLDINPVTKGHALVIGKCKAVELSDLPLEYAQAIFATAQKVMQAQRQVLGVDGISAMQLNGKSAGQSVFHYHLHLVPAHFSQITNEFHQSNDERKALAQQLQQAI